MKARKKFLRIGLMAAAAMLMIGGYTAGHAWWGKLDRGEQVQTDAADLNWEDLVPEGFVPPVNPIAQMTREQIDKLFDGSKESSLEIARLEEEMSYAPTVAALDGKKVKIPGYVVPLEFDGQTELNEFLLVPYYGACIHTPPPPANQVVHALPKSPIIVENTYDPVYAIGVIRTQKSSTNLAETGYTLDIEQVVPYTPPPLSSSQ